MLAWLLLTGREIVRLAVAFHRNAGYRLYADGSVDILSHRGGRRRATLAAGSLVLGGVAWLRFQPASGPCSAELLAGNSRKDQDWRRLQVICRLLAAC